MNRGAEYYQLDCHACRERTHCAVDVAARCGNCGASLIIQWAEGRADIAASLEANPMRNSVSVRAGIRDRENQNVAVK
jgi:hypothetical protein